MMSMSISPGAFGQVEIVRRVDGEWSRWVGIGNAEGLVVGDPIELAGNPEGIGEMTLTDYLIRRWGNRL